MYDDNIPISYAEYTATLEWDAKKNSCFISYCEKEFCVFKHISLTKTFCKCEFM